jgi:bacterioferritin (cytochrome b1)
MKEVPAHIIEMLNEALADEYAQYIEMATQASVLTGEQALYLKAFFEQQAAGALMHAGTLRERIFFLGGKPSTKVSHVKIHTTPKEAINAGVADHHQFVDRYRKILSSVKRPDGDILYEAIEEILEGEQEDLETFQRLSGKIS